MRSRSTAPASSRRSTCVCMVEGGVWRFGMEEWMHAAAAAARWAPAAGASCRAVLA